MNPINRRSFIRGSLLTAAALASPAAPRALAAAGPAGEAVHSFAPVGGAVDVNVNLSHWPFRRIPGDETEALLRKLRKNGVSEAWAGTFDGILHKDIAAANLRLVKECREKGAGMLVPFGSVNPTLPDWEDDLRRCQEEHGMPGIRLHPGYHGYDLGDARFSRLLGLVAERGLLVQLVAAMEDERGQHPLMHVPAVDLSPLPLVLPQYPDVRLIVLNGFRSARGPLPQRLASTGQVFFDIAWVDSLEGVAGLLEQVPLESVLFGTHAPFFHAEATPLKLQESPLTPVQMEAICRGNARRLLTQAGAAMPSRARDS